MSGHASHGTKLAKYSSSSAVSSDSSESVLRSVVISSTVMFSAMHAAPDSPKISAKIEVNIVGQPSNSAIKNSSNHSAVSVMPTISPLMASALNPSSRREFIHSAEEITPGITIEMPKIKVSLMPSKSAHFSMAPTAPLSIVSSSHAYSVSRKPSFREARVIPPSASLFSPTLLTISVATHSAVSSESKTSPRKASSSPTGIVFASSSSNEPSSSVSIPSSATVSVVAGASVAVEDSVAAGASADSVLLPEQAAAIMQTDVNKQTNNLFI